MARPGRRRFATAVAAVLATLAGLVTNVALGTTAAHAVNGDGTSRFATYNMHGSDNGLAWRSEIERLVADTPVVALQEVGSGPPQPVDDHRTSFRQIRLNPPRPAPFPGSVTRVTWAGGPNGSNRYVYFLQTDPRRTNGTGPDIWDGGQMNLATVTDSPADEVRVLENPTYDPDPGAPNNRYRARPLLGLRFGNTWYWNTHARGEDVQGLLLRVRSFAATDHRNWVLVGDFNVNILNRTDSEARDRSLHLFADENLVRTGRPTFVNGDNPSELDYAVTHGLPRFTASIPRGAGSDHVPVHFAPAGSTDPQPQAPTPSHTYNSVLATPSGRLLQENADHTITLGDARYDGNQTFRMYTTDALTHYLRNIGTGSCVTVASDARRDVTSRIVAGDCDDPRAQWTISHLEEDATAVEDNGGPQRWQNVAVPGLCLTASGTSVTAADCTEDPGQRWWDRSSNLGGPWKTTDRNIRIESDWFKARLATSYTSNTPVLAWPRPALSNWIYWLMFEQNDFGWNIERIGTDDNLVRFRNARGLCLGVLKGGSGSGDVVDAAHQRCDDPAGGAGAGQRWQVESYPDGSLRFRNEANHLCLVSPDARKGAVQLADCEDVPIERWNIVDRFE